MTPRKKKALAAVQAAATTSVPAVERFDSDAPLDQLLQSAPSPSPAARVDSDDAPLSRFVHVDSPHVPPTFNGRPPTQSLQTPVVSRFESMDSVLMADALDAASQRSVPDRSATQHYTPTHSPPGSGRSSFAPPRSNNAPRSAAADEGETVPAGTRTSPRFHGLVTPPVEEKDEEVIAAEAQNADDEDFQPDAADLAEDAGDQTGESATTDSGPSSSPEEETAKSKGKSGVAKLAKQIIDAQSPKKGAESKGAASKGSGSKSSTKGAASKRSGVGSGSKSSPSNAAASTEDSSKGGGSSSKSSSSNAAASAEKSSSSKAPGSPPAKKKLQFSVATYRAEAAKDKKSVPLKSLTEDRLEEMWKFEKSSVEAHLRSKVKAVLRLVSGMVWPHDVTWSPSHPGRLCNDQQSEVIPPNRITPIVVWVSAPHPDGGGDPPLTQRDYGKAGLRSLFYPYLHVPLHPDGNCLAHGLATANEFDTLGSSEWDSATGFRTDANDSVDAFKTHLVDKLRQWLAADDSSEQAQLLSVFTFSVLEQVDDVGTEAELDAKNEPKVDASGNQIMKKIRRNATDAERAERMQTVKAAIEGQIAQFLNRAGLDHRFMECVALVFNMQIEDLSFAPPASFADEPFHGSSRPDFDYLSGTTVGWRSNTYFNTNVGRANLDLLNRTTVLDNGRKAVSIVNYHRTARSTSGISHYGLLLPLPLLMSVDINSPLFNIEPSAWIPMVVQPNLSAFIVPYLQRRRTDSKDVVIHVRAGEIVGVKADSKDKSDVIDPSRWLVLSTFVKLSSTLYQDNVEERKSDREASSVEAGSANSNSKKRADRFNQLVNNLPSLNLAERAHLRKIPEGWVVALLLPESKAVPSFAELRTLLANLETAKESNFIVQTISFDDIMSVHPRSAEEVDQFYDLYVQTPIRDPETGVCEIDLLPTRRPVPLSFEGPRILGRIVQAMLDGCLANDLGLDLDVAFKSCIDQISRNHVAGLRFGPMVEIADAKSELFGNHAIDQLFPGQRDLIKRRFNVPGEFNHEEIPIEVYDSALPPLETEKQAETRRERIAEVLENAQKEQESRVKAAKYFEEQHRKKGLPPRARLPPVTHKDYPGDPSATYLLMPQLAKTPHEASFLSVMNFVERRCPFKDRFSSDDVRAPATRRVLFGSMTKPTQTMFYQLGQDLHKEGLTTTNNPTHVWKVMWEQMCIHDPQLLFRLFLESPDDVVKDLKADPTQAWRKRDPHSALPLPTRNLIDVKAVRAKKPAAAPGAKSKKVISKGTGRATTASNKGANAKAKRANQHDDDDDVEEEEIDLTQHAAAIDLSSDNEGESEKGEDDEEAEESEAASSDDEVEQSKSKKKVVGKAPSKPATTSTSATKPAAKPPKPILKIPLKSAPVSQPQNVKRKPNGGRAAVPPAKKPRKGPFDRSSPAISNSPGSSATSSPAASWPAASSPAASSPAASSPAASLPAASSPSSSPPGASNFYELPTGYRTVSPPSSSPKPSASPDGNKPSKESLKRRSTDVADADRSSKRSKERSASAERSPSKSPSKNDLIKDLLLQQIKDLQQKNEMMARIHQLERARSSTPALVLPPSMQQQQQEPPQQPFVQQQQPQQPPQQPFVQQHQQYQPPQQPFVQQHQQYQPPQQPFDQQHQQYQPLTPLLHPSLVAAVDAIAYNLAKLKGMEELNMQQHYNHNLYSRR